MDEPILRRDEYIRYGLREECANLAYPLYEAHEFAHSASKAMVDRNWDDVEMYLRLVEHELSKVDFSILGTSVVHNPGGSLKVQLQESKKYSAKRDWRGAVIMIGDFIDLSKEAMFGLGCTCEKRQAPSTLQQGASNG